MTQDFQAFLYRTGKHDSDALKNLASDSDAFLYLRTAALGALNWRVAEGLSPREEMLSYFSQLFDSREAQEVPEWRVPCG